MSRAHVVGMVLSVLAALAATAQAQEQSLFATTKVEGTENVYIFRYVRHQSMFIVTREGVIATDPIGLRRPAAKAYIEEIQKITKAPIKYVIYSHSHFDHIAGGQGGEFHRHSRGQEKMRGRVMKSRGFTRSPRRRVRAVVLALQARAPESFHTLRARNSHSKRVAARHASSVLICVKPCGMPSITCSS